MTVNRVFRRIELNHILYLTDFTEPSEFAIPYAAAFARGYDSKILALHVLTDVRPEISTVSQISTRVDRLEQGAASGMARVNSQLSGLDHETITLHHGSVWAAVRMIIEERNIDLVVTGSHRRAGCDGLMHHSVAEEIFRRANVPVLVVGPQAPGSSHNAGAFRRILFTTDFSDESKAAIQFAVSMAEEHDAKLFLLHVLPGGSARSGQPKEVDSVAHVMHAFYETMPHDVELWCKPEATVRFGDPATEILEAASDLRADLIVMGVRQACCGKCSSARPEPTIARAIVAAAKCPVLAVRRGKTQRASLTTVCC